MRVLYQIFIVVLLLPGVLSAQEDDPGQRDVTRVGVFVGPQFNFHSGTYQALDGSAVCAVCDFENGDLMKFRIEGLVEVPLSRSWMLSGRLGYQDYSGVFDRNSMPWFQEYASMSCSETPGATTYR